MKIEIGKNKRIPTLVCTREDGTVTRRRSDASFVLQDLAHFAVETSLHFNMGFYGLVNAGIDIGEFGRKVKVSDFEMPLEAFYAEHLVDLLLSEINNRVTYADFQQTFDDVCLLAGRPTIVVALTSLLEMRSQTAELLARWEVLESGEKTHFVFSQQREHAGVASMSGLSRIILFIVL